MTDDERTVLMLAIRTLNAINLDAVPIQTADAVTKTYGILLDLVSECPTCSGTGKIDVD